MVMFSKTQSNPVGAPLTKSKPEPPSPMTVCSQCISEFAPGKPHYCVKTTRRENMLSLVRHSSAGSQSAVTVSTLKGLASEQGVSIKGGTVMLKSGSKVLPVQVGNSRVKPPVSRFSHEDLMALQTSLNLSCNSTL